MHEAMDLEGHIKENGTYHLLALQVTYNVLNVNLSPMQQMGSSFTEN
jgi:hypothetical protein